MNELKKYLTSNSIFSAFSGLTMLLFSSKLNETFGFSNQYIFPVIGINLLVFAAFVFFVSIKYITNKILVYTITVLDVMWVVGSIIIIAFGLFDISRTGNILIGAVAVWIGYLAYKQFQNIK